MSFVWSQQRIHWYLRASDYGNFHQTLAQQLSPFLRAEDSICDFGCGLGRLDLLLVAHVARITGVDTDATVLSLLSQEAEKRAITNLSVCCVDALHYTEFCDVAIMCFFGTPVELMLSCAHKARRALIRVLNLVPDVPALVNKNKNKQRETLVEIEAALQKERIAYRLYPFAIEFGQPLVDWSEAEAYVQYDHPDIPLTEVRLFLQKHLCATYHSQFPWYLLRYKRLALLVADTTKIWGMSLCLCIQGQGLIPYSGYDYRASGVLWVRGSACPCIKYEARIA